jgi:type VI secretion system protein ImpE
MTSVSDAFRQGDIAAAIAAATAEVRGKPRDAGARWVLAEMLLFGGEAERADKMLDAAALDDPNPNVIEFRKLLRAEVTRGQVWHEGRAPRFQGEDATPSQQAALRALIASRLGDPAAATLAAEEAEALRPRAAGRAELANGTVLAFDDLRDADDIAAPFVEVLTVGGEHMWVPVERIRELRFEPPKRPRDLAWRRMNIELKDGTEGVVYMPATYPVAGAAPDAIRLGRVTEWSEGEGPVRGAGQRLFLAGEEALAANDLAALLFDG